jgi:hypothetical protein
LGDTEDGAGFVVSVLPGFGPLPRTIGLSPRYAGTNDSLRMEGVVLLLGALVAVISLVGAVLLVVAVVTGGAGSEERRRH